MAPRPRLRVRFAVRRTGAGRGSVWLAPAYIATAEFDPNRDDAITDAPRLLQAGVSVDLHQWARTFHRSSAVLSADVSQRQLAELGGTLRHALAQAGRSRPLTAVSWATG